MDQDLYAEESCPKCNGRMLKVASFCPHCGWRRPSGWWDRLWGGRPSDVPEDRPSFSLGSLLPLLIGLGIALLVIFQIIKGEDLDVVITLFGILYLVWRGWGIARTRAETITDEHQAPSKGPSSPPGPSGSVPDRFYCENCGSEVEPDALFCSSCGLKFGPNTPE